MNNFILLEMFFFILLYVIVCIIIVDFEIKEIKRYDAEKEKNNTKKDVGKIEMFSKSKRDEK